MIDVRSCSVQIYFRLCLRRVSAPFPFPGWRGGQAAQLRHPQVRARPAHQERKEDHGLRPQGRLPQLRGGERRGTGMSLRTEMAGRENGSFICAACRCWWRDSAGRGTRWETYPGCGSRSSRWPTCPSTHSSWERRRGQGREEEDASTTHCYAPRLKYTC